MNSVDPDYEAIAAWFALQSDAVKTHSQIVDADLVGQPYMLHIDKNTPQVFTPMMPRSADKREDNTVGRVTVAPTLLGCYIGYNRANNDFWDGSKKDPEKEDNYRGGYDICLLPFQHCLKVDNTLVPDASISDEHWLVGYSEGTRAYQPEHVGKMFLTKVAAEAISGDRPTISITMFIEVVREQGFKFSPSIHLDKGHWKADVLWNHTTMPNVSKEGNFTVTRIDEDTYQKSKNYHAALLSYAVPPAPAFSRW